MRELPNAQLVQASSILELQLTPERLTSEIVRFVDECFEAPRRADAGGRRRARTGAQRAASARRRG
jgi:hypothetical protein